MKALAVAYLAALLAASGCVSETKYGACVGVSDDRDPSLTYKASTRNIVVGVIFVETIFVPLIVLLDEFACPIGRKAVPR